MGTLLAIKQEQNTVDNFLSDYDSDRTIQAYTTILKEFFQVSDSRLITNYKITKVTYEDVYKYVLGLIDAKAKSTVNQRVGCLRAFFNYIMDHEEELDIYIKENHFANSSLNRLINRKCQKGQEVGRALSIDEIEKLMSVITKQRDKALIHFMLRTGVRKEEVMNVVWEDIKYNTIEGKWFVTIIGKGNKLRQIQLMDNMMQELNDWKEVWNPIKETIFGLNDMSNINKMLDKYCILAEIPHCTCHDLRRTTATNLIKKGMNIRELQKLLGHASISTTEGYLKDIQTLEQNLEQFITW
jgi:site-specific recombinase XerD